MTQGHGYIGKRERTIGIGGVLYAHTVDDVVEELCSNITKKDFFRKTKKLIIDGPYNAETQEKLLEILQRISEYKHNYNFNFETFVASSDLHAFYYHCPAPFKNGAVPNYLRELKKVGLVGIIVTHPRSDYMEISDPKYRARHDVAPSELERDCKREGITLTFFK